MKLSDRLWLWWNHYCTKHVIEKELGGGPGGLHWYCEKCDAEWHEAREAKVTAILKGC